MAKLAKIQGVGNVVDDGGRWLVCSIVGGKSLTRLKALIITI